MQKSHWDVQHPLWQVLPGFLGSADKGPEETPTDLSHGLEDSQPLPTPHHGHLEKIGSSPIRITSHLCAAPQHPLAWLLVNQNHSSHLRGGAEGQSSPHQDAQIQGLHCPA